MIELLHIENVAVIEKADIEFSPGLNVLTGETGAGKSIVIDALTAVTGGRSSREIIRTGSDKASVTAVFSADGCAEWLEDNGIEQDGEGKILLMRRISPDGKSICRINGCPVTAAQMRELGGLLLDIHGQNDGRKLLDERAHLTYLDAFGGLSSELNEYRAAYGKLCEKKAEIERLTLDESEKERRIDSLKYQIGELEDARIKPGELEELTSKRDLLLNASKLMDAVESAFEALYGGEDSVGAVALISGAQDMLERAARYSESFRAMIDKLLDLRYAAQDISEELRDIRDELDFSPEELDALEARLDVLRRVLRKYGEEEAALVYLENIKSELLEIEDSSDMLVRLSRDLDKQAAEALALAEALSEKRKKAAAVIERRIREELEQLNMPGVRFAVEFTAVDGEYALNGSGRDFVRFLMSANAGETPGKISRIASGGELSRIMLALKNVLGGDNDTASMVFDEIDAGVSGIAAQRVGEKLYALAARRQVLCVTHLPQIAVMADTHFEIRKSVSDGRTFTHVRELSDDGRKKELARLSGGENITETTLVSAAEQLEAAELYKKRHHELLRDKAI